MPMQTGCLETQHQSSSLLSYKGVLHICLDMEECWVMHQHCRSCSV